MTAYEIRLRLVGSEMCIRDRLDFRATGTWWDDWSDVDALPGPDLTETTLDTHDNVAIYDNSTNSWKATNLQELAKWFREESYSSTELVSRYTMAMGTSETFDINWPVTDVDNYDDLEFQLDYDVARGPIAGHEGEVSFVKRVSVASFKEVQTHPTCLLYTSPSPRD